MKAGWLLLLCASLVAPSATAPALAQAALLLRSGTPVPLKTVTDLHSKTQRQGDRFELVVEEDVTVGGQVVIPRGAIAIGEVAKHSKRGPYGKGGRLELRLLYVTAGGRNIRLDGIRSRKGAGNELPTVAATLVTGVIGSFIFGKNAVIPAGTRIIGYVHRDLPIAAAN